MFWLTLWILNRYFGDFYESKKVYVEQLKYFDWRFNLDSLNYFAENTRKISLTFNSKIADYLIGKYIRIVSFYKELFISKGQLSLESVFYHLSRIYQASLFKRFREDVQDTWYWEPPPPVLLSSATLELWSMLISTGRTPIIHDMVYVLLKIWIIIFVSFVFFNI